MNVSQVVDRLKRDGDFCRNLTEWKTIPDRPARYGGFPDAFDPRLAKGLKKRGIANLYTHQTQAIEASLRGENVCVVTPTASGKTLCYNLPVLNGILANPKARALYLFPTKALSQDQVHELTTFVDEMEVKIGTYTFDGDTPASARKAVRSAGHIVVTNPDMLHAGILPHHTIWIRLFENLEYVVIDELHTYRGVFGSHLANVLRRLKRICAFYGSDPKFICCSATIANPGELAERVVERPFRLVDDNGAPSGERHFLFYNPPVVNAELGIRKSSVKEVSRLTTHFLSKDIQSIVFARSRLRVEILTTYLKDAVRKLKKDHNLVKGYRGGYLPTERREIERGLRDGSIMAVVSTNALELGIDIGSLDVSIMTGYSGSVASTWQQAGRAGRRSGISLVVLVATSAPLDQYIINHPEYFFDQAPERATVDPNNLIIVASHIKCACFELPFLDGESFGLEATSTGEILQYLADNRVLRHVRNKWHWSSDTYPAEDISLRTAAPGNVVILDTTDNGRVIGEVDLFAAPVEVYQNAIYIHQSVQYTIDDLDLEDRKAYARPVETDYYTDAQIKVDLKVLDVFQRDRVGDVERQSGELSVTWLPTMYKKIKFGTHENVGWGEIHLPESTMHTSSYWLEFPEDCGERFKLPQEELGAALNALANALRQVAPVQVLCDPTDIRAHANLRSPFSDKPSIYLYETYPGGVGFSEKLYTHHERLLEAAVSLLKDCSCKEGCPSCIGSALEGGEYRKKGALKLAGLALGRGDAPPKPNTMNEAV
ncbi:MAG: DEAD/DEAH box helicase [Candidatus Hydrogenedentes bacterium]|nr:DEAD/DEAH box helicase [Candidatus Hydrogenedentota bacterium]